MRSAHWVFNAGHTPTWIATGQSESYMGKRQMTSHDSMANGSVHLDGILERITSPSRQLQAAHYGSSYLSLAPKDDRDMFPAQSKQSDQGRCSESATLAFLTAVKSGMWLHPNPPQTAAIGSCPRTPPPVSNAFRQRPSRLRTSNAAISAPESLAAARDNAHTAVAS